MTPIKLTYAQHQTLRELAADPEARVGSCTNMTMRSLEKKGLAQLEWTSNPGSRYRSEKWVITEAGAERARSHENVR